MADKKRILKISETLERINIFCQLQTQELRVKLISELERLFLFARDTAKTAENREEWVKICGYIAQIINSLANSYDEVRFNEQMRELENLIEEAKKRVGKAKAGTPVA